MHRSVWLPMAIFASLFLAGCGPSHEETIRQRADLLIGGLVDQNYDVCVELTDPAFVHANGANATKILYQIMGNFVKWGNITRDKVRIDQVKVDEDANTATVTISILRNDTWQLSEPIKWIRVEGQWYVAFSKS